MPPDDRSSPSPAPSQKGRDTDCDGRALWERIRAEIGRREERRTESERARQPLTTESAQIAWLAEQTHIEEKTIRAWRKGDRSPQVRKLELVCDALNALCPGEKITVDALLKGLPQRKAAPPGDAARPAPAAAAPGEEAPPGGKSSNEGPPPSETGRQDLAALRAWVEGALGRSDPLRAALARKGYAPEGRAAESATAREVTDALLDAPAEKVTRDLADIVHRSSGRARDEARDLLWHVLPLAGDWKEVLDQVASEGTSNILELKLRTQTVAEIVVARADARCCLFSPGSPGPQGAASIPFPASARAPLFHAQDELLVQAIVLNLWEESKPRSQRLPVTPPLPGSEVWGRLYAESLDSEEPKEHFETAATSELILGSHENVQRYLLFIDDTLRAHVPDLDASWVVVQRAVSKALPGLRLVRLKAKLTTPESNLRTLVNQVYKQT